MYEQKIIENLREFSAKYQYEDQKLSETCFRAADAIEERQKPKWIPVSEGLPKLGEMVVVYMHSAIYGDEVKIDRMVISNTTDIPYWSYYKGRVKAWMPLPEPPKEETDG